jgi:hypothetical protein
MEGIEFYLNTTKFQFEDIFVMESYISFIYNHLKARFKRYPGEKLLTKLILNKTFEYSKVFLRFIFPFVVKCGFLQLADILLDDKSVDIRSYNDSAFSIACEGGYFNLVKRFLENKDLNPDKAGIGRCDSIVASVHGRHFDVFDLLIKDERTTVTDRVMYELLYVNDVGRFKECLKKSKNDLTGNILHEACLCGKTEFVELLLKDERFDPNFVTPITVKTHCPLHAAVKYEHLEIVKILLKDSRTRVSDVVLSRSKGICSELFKLLNDHKNKFH